MKQWTDDDRGLECVADEFGLKRLYPRGRLFSGSGASDSGSRACEVQPSLSETDNSAEPEIGACEFAVGIIFAGSENRTCVTGCFCPAAVFKDPKVYPGCDTRIEKLAEQP